jgi:hypothetical protein
MTNPISDLDEVVRLAGVASNDEPWRVDGNGDVVCNGEDVAWPITNKADAPYIAATVNYIRQHHAAIRRAFEDADRWRAFRRELPVSFETTRGFIDAAMKESSRG